MVLYNGTMMKYVIITIKRFQVNDVTHEEYVLNNVFVSNLCDADHLMGKRYIEKMELLLND
jgi:hypothetical protein